MRFPQLAALALWLGAILWASACSSPSEASLPQGSGARLAEVASGLSFPLYLTAPPGDAARLFVEKGGAIRVVKGGILVGLAFDPAYASTGRFFIHYTNPAGDTRVSSFQVSTNPDVADPGTQQVILATPQPYSNHNGGQLLFGPDGMLYRGLGDGGASGDPQGRGQDLSNLLGAILRVDVGDGSSYTVPPDNPFVNQANARPEIWSYGLRNPWRFSFDRDTGNLYIADVGEAHFGLCFFADFCQGWVRSLRYSDGAATDLKEWRSLRPGGSITSFGEDAAGELYLMTDRGSLYQIVP